MESYAAVDSGQVLVAEEDGEVISVTGREIVMKTGGTLKKYNLRK